jgi:DNA-binding FadR family transcriptional regulator
VRTGSGCYLRVSLGNAFRLPWGASEDPGPGAFEQFQVRMLIEPRVAELAAPIIDVALLDRFDDLLDRTEAAIGAGRPDGDEDYQFHVQLAEHCGNSLLARLVRELWDLRDAEMWRRLRLRVVQPELKIQSLVDRRSIVAACRVRDSRRAKATMTRLLRRAESWFFTKR